MRLVGGGDGYGGGGSNGAGSGIESACFPAPRGYVSPQLTPSPASAFSHHRRSLLQVNPLLTHDLFCPLQQGALKNRCGIWYQRNNERELLGYMSSAVDLN
jgi:hypothetical protein